MASIYPTFGDPAAMTPKISAWHGILAPELWMTIAVVVIGTFLYRTLKKWRPFYNLLPAKYTLNGYYERSIDAGESWSARITKRYMNGNITHYFAYIYVIFVVITAGYFVMADAFSWDPSKDSSVEYYELILVFTMMFAAFMILFSNGRITTVLLNGVLGYGVAFFFVIFRAPDLALTQLVVESVTTALFLLCFKFLPDLKPEKHTRNEAFGKALISIAVGATVTLIGLAVLNYDKFTNISSYFEDAYELAGGRNIVNTILGDFRAFDTMLEVVVLFIAGLGVYSLIKLKVKKGGEDVEN
jgi:multicomponent Na+:H+ antiporter subunit A